MLMLKRDFLKRTVFGLLFGLTLILGTLYHKEIFYFVFLILLILGLREFYRMAGLTGATPLIVPGIIVGILLFTSGFLHSFFGDATLYFLVIIGVFVTSIWELFRISKTPIANVATLLFGLGYIALPLTLIQYLLYKEYEPLFVLCIFFIIWANDSGAYILGSLIGKTKLFERISPKKTWEGTLGGMISAITLVYLLPESYINFNIAQRLIITLIVVVFSTLGDLFQSMLKRSVGLKDSGSILPGHGGILDRIDSMLFAIPAVFVYLGLIGKITF